ncbi:MAG: hypothetical protein DHS20C05_18500 [Hyphococcus sp.]|nr:MAG: hypothetical protein DHS20C05_18500 [Marinicaulis sp.]
MNAIDDQKRKDAIKALVNIAMLEGFLLVAIVAVYLSTGSLTYLVGGLVGSSLIFGPMFFRWFKAHGAAMKASSAPSNQEGRK